MMNYFDSYQKLKTLIQSDAAYLECENLAIYQQEFTSHAQELLPGTEKYYCNTHDANFKTPHPFLNDIGTIDNQIHIGDVDIRQNQTFSYRVFMPKSKKTADKAIFLLHGFNEKNWDKYLPWAQHLTEQTGSAVILFPIAFHMNRTLSIWSDKRKMYSLAEKRRKMFPNVVNSSLTNVAISMRLHSRPQRFIWSGLQTYYDVLQFAEECKNGKNPLISPNVQFHFMSYSIGSFLGEILKLTNHNSYFSNSKLCLFCGGAVFNRLSPVSKFILDSEANIALYAFMVEHFEKHMKQDTHLKHYIDGPHDEGHVFNSMLDYKVKREFREDLFNNASKDIYAISLKQDTIIPHYEIINTLQGAARDIPIPVEVYDFPFPYNHVVPFPATEKNSGLIDENFKLIFGKIADFFNN